MPLIKLPHDEEINFENLIIMNFGLSGASFAGILALLQVPKLDTYLIISLVCFVLILPINLFYGLTNHAYDIKNISTINANYVDKVSDTTIVSILIAFVGILGLISHFCLALGILFFIVAVVSIRFGTSDFALPKTQVK